MIFVTLGSQKFQFNRLLKAIDELVKDGKIKEDVFAQIGYSDYLPENYSYKKFLDREEFREMQMNADIVITHGGTGAIIGAVKCGKKVIAIPRLKQFGEHVDDHQMQLIEQFKELNLICGIDDCEKLDSALQFVISHEFNTYESNTQRILQSIDDFING